MQLKVCCQNGLKDHLQGRCSSPEEGLEANINHQGWLQEDGPDARRGVLPRSSALKYDCAMSYVMDWRHAAWIKSTGWITSARTITS